MSDSNHFKKSFLFSSNSSSLLSDSRKLSHKSEIIENEELDVAYLQDKIEPCLKLSTAKDIDHPMMPITSVSILKPSNRLLESSSSSSKYLSNIISKSQNDIINNRNQELQADTLHDEFYSEIRAAINIGITISERRKRSILENSKYQVSSSESLKVLSIGPSKLKQACSHVIPELSSKLHKGQMGRIAVLGGSKEYTGAPYYAAQSSLLFGADLAFVFCSRYAAIPIKSYSPELMVLPFDEVNGADEENNIGQIVSKIVEYFSRIHVLCIGPGLGRNLLVQNSIVGVIKKAIERNISMVIDADGLQVLCENLSLFKDYHNVVITPNKPELCRLIDSVKSELDSRSVEFNEIVSEYKNGLSSNNYCQVIKTLSAYLGVSILVKGSEDIICIYDHDVIYTVQAEGSPRRCGGQGDILSGITSVTTYWASLCNEMFHNIGLPEAKCFSVDGKDNSIISEEIIIPNLASALILSSSVTRTASNLAFREKGRSMTSPDVMKKIGQALIQFQDL